MDRTYYSGWFSRGAICFTSNRLRLGVPTPRSGDDRCAAFAARLRPILPATPIGRETVNALTFELDHPMGAGHALPPRSQQTWGVQKCLRVGTDPALLALLSREEPEITANSPQWWGGASAPHRPIFRLLRHTTVLPRANSPAVARRRDRREVHHARRVKGGIRDLAAHGAVRSRVALSSSCERARGRVKRLRPAGTAFRCHRVGACRSRAPCARGLGNGCVGPDDRRLQQHTRSRRENRVHGGHHLHQRHRYRYRPGRLWRRDDGERRVRNPCQA